MAKLNSQTLVITVSELVRDNVPTRDILDPELIAQLEAVISELAGSGVLVEVALAHNDD